MNLDDFETYLDNDLSWRKVEMSELLLLTKETNKEVLLKSLILLIYAHWEGYIKKASKLYLKYVNDQKIEVSKLSNNFLAIILKSQISQCVQLENKLTMSGELAFIDSYFKKKGKRFKVNIDPDKDLERDIIDTQSNLKPKVLKSICEILGLDYKTPIRIREQYLNANLLLSRNMIGHGSPFNNFNSHEFNLSIDDVEKLKNIVFTIIDNFRDELLNYANNEFYLAAKEDSKLVSDINNEEKLERELARI